MTQLYQRVARPALFRLGGGDAERAHEWTLRRLAALSGRPAALRALRAAAVRGTPRTVFGLRFPNPVGLAAGMDKDGRALPAWAALGFGFVEVGTVTARPQPGNPRPRVFRLPASQAVINRMGFNNEGAAALATRLATLRPLSSAGMAPLRQAPRLGIPLGISLGKSKVVPLEDAVEDYLAALRAVLPYADYVAVNVSSPNTPGLRGLQDRAQLSALLAALRAELASPADPAQVPAHETGTTPVLVKIAPDLTEHAIGEALEVCVEHGVAGLIATNTTVRHDGEQGGLSGRPLTGRALEVVTFVAKHSELPVVGVGGIMSVDDALRMLDAGASLVQLYTGLIYRGPSLLRAIVRATR